jgi:hypothetical protein
MRAPENKNNRINACRVSGERGTGQTAHLTAAVADHRVIRDGERTHRETQLILAVGHEMGQIKADGERDGQK